MRHDTSLKSIFSDIYSRNHFKSICIGSYVAFERLHFFFIVSCRFSLRFSSLLLIQFCTGSHAVMANGARFLIAFSLLLNFNFFPALGISLENDLSLSSYLKSLENRIHNLEEPGKNSFFKLCTLHSFRYIYMQKDIKLQGCHTENPIYCYV